MLGVSRAGGSACACGPTVCAYRSITARRLCLLSRAVLLSQYARSSYGKMLRSSAFSCGAARVRPPGLGAGLTGGRWGDERVCPGEMRDPYPPLLRLVVVEPPDPHVDEVLRGTLSQGEERLELPHADVGSSMWEEGRREAPVGADVVEMSPEGVYQVVRWRSVVDVVGPR